MPGSNDPRDFLRSPLRYPGCAGPHQTLQLMHEFRDIFKFKINRSETNIRNFIEFFQTSHDHLADFRGGTLAFGRFLHIFFYRIHDSIQLRRRNGALLAGAQEPGHYLVSIEGLAAAIFLDHHVGDFVDTLVRRESSFTFQAFASSSNRLTFARLTRINDFIFEKTAEWTLHIDLTLIDSFARRNNFDLLDRSARNNLLVFNRVFYRVRRNQFA